MTSRLIAVIAFAALATGCSGTTETPAADDAAASSPPAAPAAAPLAALPMTPLPDTAPSPALPSGPAHLPVVPGPRADWFAAMERTWGTDALGDQRLGGRVLLAVVPSSRSCANELSSSPFFTTTLPSASSRSASALPLFSCATSSGAGLSGVR